MRLGRDSTPQPDCRLRHPRNGVLTPTTEAAAANRYPPDAPVFGGQTRNLLGRTGGTGCGGRSPGVIRGVRVCVPSQSPILWGSFVESEFGDPFDAPPAIPIITRWNQARGAAVCGAECVAVQFDGQEAGLKAVEGEGEGGSRRLSRGPLSRCSKPRGQ